jgi:hypothetical protein
MSSSKTPSAHDCAIQLNGKRGKNMANPTYEVQANDAPSQASVAKVDMKLEILVIPVSDVNRAKEFSARLGWRLDADRSADENFRLVQFTPPGSWCSQLGMVPRSVAEICSTGS